MLAPKLRIAVFLALSVGADERPNYAAIAGVGSALRDYVDVLHPPWLKCRRSPLARSGLTMAPTQSLKFSANFEPNMIEKVPAALMLAVCLVMLLRLVMGAARRRAFDARLLGAWAWTVSTWRRASRWRSNRRDAALAARDAIRRASAASATAAADVRREGNVYHPQAFRDPRKPH